MMVRYACLLSIVLIWGCQTPKKEPVKASLPLQDIYLHCQVTGDDEREFVSVLVQLFRGQPEGKAIKMEEPGFVELNGVVMKPDSTPVTGYFYEMLIPTEDFRGEHKLTIADANNEQASETFTYSPFQMVSQPGNTISKQDLVFELRGLDDREPVQLVLIDTVYRTSDINRIDTVLNGKITIAKEDLQDIREGPVTLLLYKEEKRDVKAARLKGGRLNLSFGVKREFELMD
ncbi:MAG TPA: hypothetical protein VGD26_01770 [Chitinophagaceae bacterium]